MQLKKGGKLFVRIDHKIGDKAVTERDIQDHPAYVRSAKS